MNAFCGERHILFAFNAKVQRKYSLGSRNLNKVKDERVLLDKIMEKEDWEDSAKMNRCILTQGRAMQKKSCPTRLNSNNFLYKRRELKIPFMSVSNNRVHEKAHCPALAGMAVAGSTAVDEAGIAMAIVYPAQARHSLVKG